MIDYTVFEILIYRIKEKDFYALYEKREQEFINKVIPEPENKIYEKSIKRLEFWFFENYGGPWNYNQIIGAIEIFLLGDQIRGDYWLSTKKRYRTKMKNKNISKYGKIFEMHVFNDTSNNTISSEIKKRISDFLKYDKRLVPDFRAYDAISKYIDWKKLTKEYRRRDV